LSLLIFCSSLTLTFDLDLLIFWLLSPDIQEVKILGEINFYIVMSYWCEKCQTTYGSMNVYDYKLDHCDGHIVTATELSKRWHQTRQHNRWHFIRNPISKWIPCLKKGPSCNFNERELSLMQICLVTRKNKGIVSKLTIKFWRYKNVANWKIIISKSPQVLHNGYEHTGIDNNYKIYLPISSLFFFKFPWWNCTWHHFTLWLTQ
jgi:hypothetical protein